uniref:Si:dkey-260j18.2 n=1 Tax=Neogobius melanostomus TaxID=47308 RepID=A0A8C6SBT6_9GOBI
MNAVRGGTVTWRPQPWQDEEDFPDDSTTPLGDYITHGLKQLLDAQQLCDVTLLVEGKKFMCHRVLLAAVSPYFRAMFTSPLVESRLTEIRLEDVAPAVMDTVIRFVYSGEAGLSLDTAEDLFTAANRLQVMPLQELCSRFLFEHLSVENCLGMYSLARSHHDQLLLRASLRLVAQHFPRVSRQKDFLLLDHGTLGSLLASDRLGVHSEAEVYDAARRWAEHQPLERYVHMPALLRHLRPGLLSHEESRRLRKELGSAAAARDELGGPLRPREGMFEKKIVCVDLTPREDDQPRDFTVDCFDPRTGKWEEAGAARVVGESRLRRGRGPAVRGGRDPPDGVGVRERARDDTVLDRWTERADMLQPRAMLGLLGCGGALYALGGSNRSALLDTSEILDLSTMAWSVGPRLPLLYCTSWAGRRWSRTAPWCTPACSSTTRSPTAGLKSRWTRAPPSAVFREGRGTEREVTVTNDRDRAGRAATARPARGVPRAAAQDSGGGRGPVEEADLRVGRRERLQVLRQYLLLEAGLEELGAAARETARRHGGVSQFGCTTLKFPKKHILNRLRSAKENCKKNARVNGSTRVKAGLRRGEGRPEEG